MLASTSPYRRTLMERLGVPFRAVAPRFDESSVSPAGKNPQELAEALALGKARSIAAVEPGATVIGSDQLVAIDGRIFGKPGSVDRAIEQLQALAGATHELYTALVVIQANRSLRHTDRTRLRMRPLTSEEIARYVAHDLPLDCAGSYKLEERGIVLFDSIETDDYTAIMGLPLLRLTSILRGLGFAIP
ncbi:MAG: Maf family protein [Isosphaeraceae bacterium]